MTKSNTKPLPESVTVAGELIVGLRAELNQVSTRLELIEAEHRHIKDFAANNVNIYYDYVASAADAVWHHALCFRNGIDHLKPEIDHLICEIRHLLDYTNKVREENQDA